jgi:hypothetical protein
MADVARLHSGRSEMLAHRVPVDQTHQRHPREGGAEAAEEGPAAQAAGDLSAPAKDMHMQGPAAGGLPGGQVGHALGCHQHAGHLIEEPLLCQPLQ